MIEEIPVGHERQWVKCKTCGNVAYYDFVPYTLSSPIMTLPCGHDTYGTNKKLENAERISADEALIFLESCRDEEA